MQNNIEKVKKNFRGLVIFGGKNTILVYEIFQRDYYALFKTVNN